MKAGPGVIDMDAIDPATRGFTIRTIDDTPAMDAPFPAPSTWPSGFSWPA